MTAKITPAECSDSRPHRPGRGKLRRQDREAVAIAAAIAALHALGLGLLVLLVVPAHLELGDGGVFGIGLGLTAYALGARPAFDADHLAASDTVTRRLIGMGHERAPRPSGVGFFFALGHSAVVFALAILLALG